MNYKYIGVPQTISYEECCKNSNVLAPSKYTRFLPQNKDLFVPMSSICTESKSKIVFDRKKKYEYSEIGDIDVSNGTVEHHSYYGSELPSENPKQCKQGDILVSTVRTYRGGVGMVTDDFENHCCSPAILVIRNVTDERITKEYLYALLRTDFFIEQILGFQNRGMYPRLDSDAMDKVVIPIPNDANVIKYISDIVRACINKHTLIRKRHKEIIRLIDDELVNNQKGDSLKYEFPKISEIASVGRLDVSRYSKEYKEYEQLISGYSNGCFKFSKKGYSVKRGQNLQVSCIGESIYSNAMIKGFYRLAVSSNFSEYSTVDNYVYLGNPLKLSVLKKGEIVFSARGAQFGRVIIYPDTINDIITNIDSLVISNDNSPLFQNIFIAMFLSRLRWNKHIYKIAITGSGANSLTAYQSDDINFPNFPEQKQKEIAALYHNPKEYDTSGFTLENFLEKDNEFNSEAGIYELDKTANQLKQLLNKAIDDIVNDREVEIRFSE